MGSKDDSKCEERDASWFLVSVTNMNTCTDTPEEQDAQISNITLFVYMYLKNLLVISNIKSYP